MASDSNISRAFSALHRFFKSVPDEQLADMSDLWSEPGSFNTRPSPAHNTPTGRQLGLGSDQAASGTGASKMTGEYSDTTPQQGISRQYEAIGADLNSFSAKALTTLRTARGEVRKAEVAEIIEDNIGTRAASLAKATDLLNRAGKLLAKAAEDEDEDDEDDEDKDKRKNADFSKALQLHRALKAKIDRMSGADTVQGPAAKAAIDLLKLTPAQFVGALAGNGLSMPPDMGIRKAAGLSPVEKIEAAEDAGQLSAEEATRAMMLVQRLNQVNAGQMPVEQFMNAVKNERSRAIHDIFGVAIEPARLTLAD